MWRMECVALYMPPFPFDVRPFVALEDEAGVSWYGAFQRSHGYQCAYRAKEQFVAPISYICGEKESSKNPKSCPGVPPLHLRPALNVHSTMIPCPGFFFWGGKAYSSCISGVLSWPCIRPGSAELTVHSANGLFDRGRSGSEETPATYSGEFRSKERRTCISAIDIPPFHASSSEALLPSL